MKSVHVIGVPLDLGGNRRGVDMGPSAFRIAGLGERIAALGYTVFDKGDLAAPIPETQELRDERKKYIRDIAKVCQKLYQTTLAALEEGAMPIVLGGDHSLAAGSVAAAADWARNKRNLPVGTRRRRRSQATFTACRSPRCSVRNRASSRKSARCRRRCYRLTP